MPDSESTSLSQEAAKSDIGQSIYMTDGLWFLGVEEVYGFEAAFEMNQRVWARGSYIHGRRVLKNLDISGKKPLEALVAMIFADPIMAIRQPEVTDLTDNRMVFRCHRCPPEEARLRDGRGIFNGKPGCTLLLKAYAELIDPLIQTNCVCCTPNPVSPEYWCEWEFRLVEQKP